MTMPCEALADRLPDLVAGRRPWTPEEQAHLASCTECAAEYRIVVLAAGIGAAVAERAAGAIDTNALLARLRSPDRRQLLLRGGLGLAAAALLVLLVRGVGPSTVGAGEGPLLLPELDSLTLEELTLVADDLDPAAGDLPLPDDELAEDLDTIQLERLLRSLEA